MDIQITIADQLTPHLRSMRRVRGLTQVQLAARLGVTQSRVSAIEKDASKLPFDQLLRVLSALNGTVVLQTADAAPAAITSSPDTTSPDPSQSGVW